MILYTPMQLELVLAGLEEMQPEYREMRYEGVSVLVEKTEEGKNRIIRILSTNPYDYLKTNLQPGRLVEEGYKSDINI